MKSPFELSKEAEMESYIFFDKNMRALPKKSDGSIDTTKPGFHNNDVDAFRHAYVSGIFLHEYGEKTATLLGWLNEFVTPESPNEHNMDFWNNAVGRELALKNKTKENLAKAIKDALSAGQLILRPSDPRKYEGSNFKPDSDKAVIVLKESQTGGNEVFFDFNGSLVMTRKEFVQAISQGKYPGYKIRSIDGVLYPVSRQDKSSDNNLG